MKKRIKKKRTVYCGYTRSQFRREYIKLLRTALHRIEIGCGYTFLKYIQECMTGNYTVENDISLHKIKYMVSLANAVKIPIECIVHPNGWLTAIHNTRREYKRDRVLGVDMVCEAKPITQWGITNENRI